jgi:uncharacterized protein YbcI
MSSSNWKQQEATLVECLPDFLVTQLGHAPEQVICQMDDRQIVVTVNGAVTQLEQLLQGSQQEALANHIRTHLDAILRPRLQVWIAELLQVHIVDLWVKTDLPQGRMIAIAILAPTVPLEDV